MNTKKKSLLTLIMSCIFLLAACNSSATRTPEQTINRFFELIAAQDYKSAQDYLNQNDEYPLTAPVSALAKAIHQNIHVERIERIETVDDILFTADVWLKTLDTMQIMSKATLTYMLDAGNMDNPEDTLEQDQAINEIYRMILSQPDLPKKEVLCIVTLNSSPSGMTIQMDEQLKNVLEGEVSQNMEIIQHILSQ